TAGQRGNAAARVRPWTEGNAVRPLVHGRAYFAALADAVDAADPGDLVLVVSWRGTRTSGSGTTGRRSPRCWLMRRGGAWRSRGWCGDRTWTGSSSPGRR